MKIDLPSKETIEMNLLKRYPVTHHQHFLQCLRHRWWPRKVKLKTWQGVTKNTAHQFMDKTCFTTPMCGRIITRQRDHRMKIDSISIAGKLAQEIFATDVTGSSATIEKMEMARLQHPGLRCPASNRNHGRQARAPRYADDVPCDPLSKIGETVRAIDLDFFTNVKMMKKFPRRHTIGNMTNLKVPLTFVVADI